MSIKEKVKNLIEEGLNKRSDIFLIDFSITEDNNIHVVIDSDNGVNVSDIIEMSRQIEHHLDRDDEDFSLTVTSVDITKPFYLKRQFLKNLNRKIKVKTKEGESEGVLIEINNDDIIIEYKVREPKKIGKGKVTIAKQDKIAFEDIIESKVVLNF